MAAVTYFNRTISKLNARVFAPANRCIYCPDGVGPFTKEHVVPKGLGGGFILPHASCATCQEEIKEIETYCMRGPFLAHRLRLGLVQHLKELGETLPIKYEAGGKRFEHRFPLKDFPNYLILPRFHNAPGILARGSPDRVFAASYVLWGSEAEFDVVNRLGNAILAERFDLDKFARVLAKIAHGFVAGELRIENFDPWLPELILGRSEANPSYLIGAWPDDKLPRPQNILHQIGISLEPWGGQMLVSVRLRLFAEQAEAPIYRVVVGTLTTPVEEVFAKLGLTIEKQA